MTNTLELRSSARNQNIVSGNSEVSSQKSAQELEMQWVKAYDYTDEEKTIEGGTEGGRNKRTLYINIDKE